MISSLIIIFLISLGIISSVFSEESPKTIGSLPMENINVDGTINEAEWADRDWKVKFYLDIDEVFNPPDTDGYNYLYLGEDLINFYIGLDLCSDQTGDITKEWVGVWLNVNNRSFNDLSGWASYLDNGTESLLHDVENNTALSYFTNELSISSSGWDFNDDNEYNAIYGSTEGNYIIFDDGGGPSPPFFNITSVANNSDYVSWIDFSVDITKWFTIFPQLSASGVYEINFLIRSQTNVSVTKNEIILWNSDGTIDINDLDQVKPINDNIGFVDDTFYYNPSNLSSDYKMKFSLFTNHSAPFMVQFDRFEFSMRYNETNHQMGALLNPFASITNYEIEWDFGPSANNASNHRMFEIKIPKSELENYDPNEDIGIIVGGYGTMAFPFETYWAFGEWNSSIRNQRSENYKYYNMQGCEIPFKAIHGYYLSLIIAIVGVITIIFTKKKLKICK